MDEYKKFLAENILSEQKIITYRFLSRALKVNVNVAKRMLFDFHQWQNAKKPGAVHAAYIVYGVRQPDHEISQGSIGEDGDVEMTNSGPDPLAGTEQVPALTLSLVPEDQLEDALSSFEKVTSIHLYSLGPHPLRDTALLSDAATLPPSLDAAEQPQIYGTIINRHVRRRERKGGNVRSAATTARPQESKAPVKTPGAASTAKEESKAGSRPPAKESAQSSIPTKKPIPTLKSSGSSGSGIMQSFAKAAAATKTKKPEVTPPETPSVGDSSMHPMSEDDEDDSEVLPKPKSQNDGSSRKTKREREEELRRMMEDDEDEMIAVDNTGGETTGEEATEKEPAQAEEPEKEEEAPEPTKEEPTEIISASGNGRRRGRRRVMKKKQILDDQGYLVTLQEPGWESFSEDEAPPPVPKSKPAPPTSGSQTTKPKKSTGKNSQGSIMSFFSKK
ncbi:hypothetical protein VTK73DRAFT_6951 [Phialemonium thermophilum]|uniref:DNA polymerase delta subunit 3 n=1 Tax=Phialemonium thermophilum TaxID=223376 RepID=A0ABR3XUK7_9PEZI